MGFLMDSASPDYRLGIREKEERQLGDLVLGEGLDPWLCVTVFQRFCFFRSP